MKSTGPKPTTRYKKARRIKQWCDDTRTSRATTWRRIADGTILIEYYGNVLYVVAGPAAFADQVA
jgi:hypothetical protein